MNTLCGEETQDWTGHWSVNYTGTQDFIYTLSHNHKLMIGW